MALHPLDVVLMVLTSLPAYTKQSTQVTGAHPHDFVFLEFQDRLVPDFFRMGSFNSCSATSIIVGRIKINRWASYTVCSNAALRCCKACTSRFALVS